MTRDDVLAAIDAAIGTPPNDPGETAADYAVRHNLTTDSARNRLEKGVREGKLLKGHRYVARSGGSMYPLPVYRAA